MKARSFYVRETKEEKKQHLVVDVDGEKIVAAAVVRFFDVWAQQ